MRSYTHMRIAALFTLLVLGATVRDAGAIAACAHRSGWSLASGAKLPKHPTLAYFSEARGGRLDPKEFHAAIDGKKVSVKVAIAAAAPYVLALVEVDSSATGKLAISYGADAPATTYTIDAGFTAPKSATGTLDRFHQAFRHSTVHELEDGLAVVVDVPAIMFTARWRRDDKAPWQAMQLAARSSGGKQTAHLGELGCVSNFSVPILESGIELELVATLPDRSTLPVKLPARVVLAPLPPGAPKSSP